MLWEAQVLVVEGVPSPTPVLSWPSPLCVKDGQPRTLPSREGIFPSALLRASILARMEPK